jgi:hypothetical protein
MDGYGKTECSLRLAAKSIAKEAEYELGMACLQLDRAFHRSTIP